MSNFVLELEINYNFPNLTIYRTILNGVQTGWRVIPNGSYVMCRTTANDVEYDEEGNEIPITYYCTEADLPLNYNWDNFSWVAVLRSEVLAEQEKETTK